MVSSKAAPPKSQAFNHLLRNEVESGGRCKGSGRKNSSVVLRDLSIIYVWGIERKNKPVFSQNSSSDKLSLQCNES